MTDMMRNIIDDSKTDVQITVEAFIEARVGVFDADLISATEMSETLRAGPLLAQELMEADRSSFSPKRISMVMKNIHGAMQLRARQWQSGPVEVKVWAVRNAAEYKRLSPSMLFDVYKSQVAKAKKKSTLTIIK